MFGKLINRFKKLSENNRNVVTNVIGAFAIKGFALIVSLFTMPAYLDYFNDNEILGLWFTILSVLTWILNFDLGIGNGLRNKLTEALAKGNTEDAKRYISSAYFSVGTIGALLIAVFLFAFDYLNWNRILNIDSNLVSEEALLLTVKIVFIGIVLQLFFKLITSVLYAIQKSSANNFVSLVTSMITLICVSLIPSGENDRNIICMAIVNVFAVIIPLIVSSIIVFSGGKLKNCLPSFKYICFKHTKEVLGLGGLFLLVQLMYMVIMNTNEYLITIICGNEPVTDYQIYHKLFSLGATMFHLAMTPIWSAVTKAMIEQNAVWIRKLYRILWVLCCIGTLAIFAVIPFSQWLINVWLADEAIIVSVVSATAFALLGSLLVLNTCLSSIANGLGKLTTQAICFGIGAVIKIPLAIMLVSFCGSWIGVVWANVISVGLYCLIEPFVLRKALSKMKDVTDNAVTDI